MKYLIFLLLISSSVFSQAYTIVNPSDVPKDTVDVVMLVSDTSDIMYDRVFMYGEIVDGKHVDYFKMDTIPTGEYDNSVWWMFGKEVREALYDVRGVLNGRISNIPQYTHSHYLDSNGDKLRDGLVVWMAKQVK